MNHKHNFTLDCIPTPQARVRHAVRAGHSMAYKSQAQKRNEVELDALIRQHKPDVPKEKPIAIYIKAFLPIPKSATKKFRAACADEHMPVTKKPDLDNYVKQLLDSMTRTGFWIDDSQVAVLSCVKMYSERPRWEIEYYEIV